MSNLSNVRLRNHQLVVFTLDEQRYALYLSAVERIIRAVEVTPLPKAPEIVLGVINLQGEIVPVVNIRRRFRLPERELGLSDHILVARTLQRRLALVTTVVSGLLERARGEVTATEAIFPGIEYVEGVAKLRDGLILIHDLDKFLSLDEGQRLDRATKKI